jgi:ABC-type uncharacterized transport system YnjBCD substrate-binding protein
VSAKNGKRMGLRPAPGAYTAFIQAIRWQLVHDQLTLAQVDDHAGLQDGYLGKAM